MKRNTILLFAVMGFISLNSLGQRTCGSYEVFLDHFKKDARFREKVAKIEEHYRSVQSSPFKAVTGTVTIPVHVIVVYSNSSQNISDAQIQSQISVLNEDYRKLNSDWPSTPAEFYSLVTDAEIEFTLQGIERHSNSRSSWGTNDLVKATYPPYSPNTHLNIWVCNIGDYLGYAQFPGGNPATDGVVISPQYFGSSDYGTSFYLSPPFDKGRTATHEIGHWLNLRHIWGDGPCGVTDHVDDTPDAAEANFYCPSHPHPSCNSNDMFMNYMDYVDDACMHMFSNGQKTRMRALFEPGGTREPFANDGNMTCTANACDGDITLSLKFDNYPEETSWTLIDENGTVIDEGMGYTQAGQTITINWSLSQGTYRFSIYDSYGDGICCSTGNGSYSLTDGCNSTIQSGGSFFISEGITFCVPDGGSLNIPPVANANGPYSGTVNQPVSFSSNGSTDSDGTIVSYLWSFGDGSTSTQPNPTHTYTNTDNYTVSLTVTDNDGDSDTDVTSTTVTDNNSGETELSYDTFESGWGNWTDGGSDCMYYSGGTRAYEGNAAINIQDNSGVSSSFYLTNGIDVHTPGYTQIEVEFYFYAYSMENGEDFWLQYYDGSSWITVADFVRGTDFDNNTFYAVNVTISELDLTFPTDMRIRFMCDASGNYDDVYIDNVKISASTTSAARIEKKTTIRQIGAEMRSELGTEISENLKVYPNPATNELIIKIAVEDGAKAYIYNASGLLINSFNIQDDITNLNISDLNPGLYLLKVEYDDDISTVHFVKQ